MDHGNKAETSSAEFFNTHHTFESGSWNLEPFVLSEWCDAVPKYPISELHHGNFLDSLEFQSWKVNFKTEVCSKSADPRLTMQMDQRS